MELTYEVFSAGEFQTRWSSFFPFGAPAESKAATAIKSNLSQQAAEQPRRRILVVDDHRDTLRSMTLLLTRLGYHVLAAENMTDAIRIAEEEHFDILLSDIGLPDGSGLELMKKIRETRNVPALALSGFGMDDDVQRSRDAGFFDHLVKPVSLDRLQAAIAELDAQPG